MLATTNGEVNANPSAVIATHDPPVGRHWPTASPPVNGEEGGGAEPISRPPGEHGLRDLHSPGDAAFARLAAVATVVTQRCE